MFLFMQIASRFLDRIVGKPLILPKSPSRPYRVPRLPSHVPRLRHARVPRPISRVPRLAHATARVLGEEASGQAKYWVA